MGTYAFAGSTQEFIRLLISNFSLYSAAEQEAVLIRQT